MSIDRTKIEAGTALILEGLGVWTDRDAHNFRETPRRVADVYAELFSPEATGWPVFDEDYTDEVVLRKHQFWTVCPHHLLPVKLVAAIAYIPNGKVIGASKLMRMIAECNTRPMTQERLTAEILCRVADLTKHTSLGAAVLLVGKHGCFEIRGVRSHAAEMVTMKFTGMFQEDIERRRAFLEMVKA